MIEQNEAIEIAKYGNVSFPKKAEDLTIKELNHLRAYMVFIEDRLKELKINLVVTK